MAALEGHGWSLTPDGVHGRHLHKAHVLPSSD